MITGAASGIGRATAALVGRLGGRVAAVDQDAAGLRDVVAKLDGSGHSQVVWDLRQVERISQWMIELAEQNGPVHGLVHAAGVPCVSPLRALAPEVYRDAFAVNTEAALALGRGFDRKRVYAGDHGSLVFIASVMALIGAPAAIGYSMTKAALIGMARSMAVELAPKRIRVNCVAPGFVRTPMTDRVSYFWDAERESQVELLHPLGWGEPDDVANAIVFLLATTGRWITGTVLTVDGGYTAV